MIQHIFKYLPPALLILLSVIFNSLVLKNTFAGILFGLMFFLYFGYLAGNFALRRHTLFWKEIFGILLLISFIIIFGSALYISYSLNNFAFIFLLTLIGISCVFLPPQKNSLLKISLFQNRKLDIKTILVFSLFIILDAICFFILIRSVTGDAIRSPWQVLPKDFFLVYFFATLFLMAGCLYSKKESLSLASLILHFFLSVSIALIIYKFGYGFDPFIHQATESLIAEKGVILPKPLYYIGQYAMVVFLSKLFILPTRFFDLLLLPVLFSLFLPLTLFFSLKNTYGNVFGVTVAAASFLIIPFSPFIATTPQGISNLFILLLIILSPLVLLKNEYRWIIFLGILTLAALAFHPLSGIPALLFFFFVVIFILSEKKMLGPKFFRITLLTIIFSFAGIILPLLFLLNSKNSTLLSSLHFNVLKEPSNFLVSLSFLAPYLKNHFRLIFDSVYWYENNLRILLLVFGILGALLFIKKQKFNISQVFLFSCLVFLSSYLLLRLFISFPSLIDYEQQNYPARILEISFYFLIPLIMNAILFACVRSQKRQGSLRLMIILFLSFFITSSLYISYPRFDEYRIDRGYNITQAGIDAVHYIDETSPGNYAVLANQMTSVAAIREFGFKKYYPDKNNPKKTHFFYPIPTGDPLYQYYLKMVYTQPLKKTAVEAGNFLGIRHVYFVLEKYWEKYDQLVEEAKQEADLWQSIQQGSAHVFYFHVPDKTPEG